MRDISKWSEELRRNLRNSDELKVYVDDILHDAEPKLKQREIVRISQLITEVELGLTLLREIAPDEPATSVSALLLGYRFPVAALENEQKWQLVQKARFYLVRRKGKQWERSLSEYIHIDEYLRIFRLQDINNVPQLIPTSIFPRRLELYRQTISQVPRHKKPKIYMATSGLWYATVSHKGNSPVEVPIHIPEAVAQIPLTPQVTFRRTRVAVNSSYTVTMEELLEAAQEMDEKLCMAGYDAENYDQRLTGIALQLYDAHTEDFQYGRQIEIEKLVHIVGLLNVGKSTLLEILIYYFAKQEKRCALLVNDVAAAVRLASLFREGLGIPAAPVLGSDRAEHLKKVFEPILLNKGEEIEQGAIHPAWRWFSPVCPLLALVQSEEKWEFGNEPCHSLYQKITLTKNSNEAIDTEDDEEKETEDKYTCPFYYKCPRHQLERDIAQALVWILTPASFIHTPVPLQVLPEKQTFAEAVYYECDFIFIDEADRVQIQLDEAFAPDEVLLDNSDSSFLNKLALNLEPIYNSNRTSMTADWFEAWTNAQYDAQKAINRMCPLLYKQSKLVEWLGQDPFTDRSLFARIIRELLNQPEEENSQESSTSKSKTKRTRTQRITARQQSLLAGLTSPEQRKYQKQLMEDLGDFLQAPLSRRLGGELSTIALSLLSAESESFVLTEIGDWWERWLQVQNLPQPDELKFEQLKQQSFFAILVTILDNRLGFLVDNFTTIHRFLDLHDTSQSLVNRPPRDYLPVVPTAPVGNILGFRYMRDRSNNKGGKLEYFRYVGVGRYLLLNFPHLFAVDGWDGPHTILISGTSYAPGTPAYHIRKNPTVLLESVRNNQPYGDVGIGESEFFFSPQKNKSGEYIALSGKLPAARKLAADEMVKAICYRPNQAKNFLDNLLDSLQEKAQQDPDKWSDRRRLLLLTNSYDEAALVESILQPLYRLEHIDNIAVLRRDNAPANLKGIRRSQIRDLSKLPPVIVIAPLMALERGHNILNDNRIAAFGAAVFLSRPMPVPDDWQTTVQQLNDWALENACQSALYESLVNAEETLTLTKVEDRFYKAAIAKMVELNSRPASFKGLNDNERRVLCATQLVSIWQVIGRLVRGGVPCIVHFLDVKFAPKSAVGEIDQKHTSLLVGILQELQTALTAEGKQPWEKTLVRSLYGSFFQALTNTKELHHEL